MSEVDPFDIRAQEREETFRIECEREAQHLEIEDLKWLMSDKRGRRVVWRLLDKTGVYRSSFTGNSTTFFNEGARNVGLQLLLEINQFCPDRYAQMVTEQRERDDKRPNADDRWRKQH